MNVISFPNLGITFNINPVAFHIGSKPIYWYALIILTGFLFGLLFVYKTCGKRGVNKDNIWDIALIGLIAGIIGARIYYVLFALDEFDSVADMFKIWNGGLAIYGGIIGAAISAFIYCRIKKLDTAKVFDVCAPGLLIGQAIGRFGNFVNAEVFGGETDNLFAMSINGAAAVHPVFLYESVWNILGLIILLIFRDRKKNDGQVFCFYIFWYSLGRIFLEGMRNPTYILYVIPNVLGISQLVAAVLIIASAVCFVYLQLKPSKSENK
ncbi:MAG: prolipoprotein diacylglyceryl transferase [Oscillospiraceae bacterium]|nr:prolipoprotein diacylglyceryl transferase [Oscillospiraceae bacterium]